MVSPANRLVLIDNSKTFRGYRMLLNDLDANGTGTHARFWYVPYDPARVRYPTRYPPRRRASQPQSVSLDSPIAEPCPRPSRQPGKAAHGQQISAAVAAQIDGGGRGG